MDLAELEMAFAKDPSSDAFLALSQAYLEQGRFMEAMVVCKKGIRGQPESVEGRLLLAKVYAGQGKVPKAIDEVKSLLELDEGIPEAHFFLGQLHERSGRFEEAIDSFKEALVLDRHHQGAKEALSAKGIEFDPGPSPEELEAQRQAEEEAARQAAEDERLRAEAEAQRLAEEQAAIAQATGMPLTNPGMSSPPMTNPGMPVTNPGTYAGGFGQPDTGATPAVGSMPPQHSGAMPQVGYNFGGYDPLAQHAEASKKKLGLGFSFGLFAILLFVVAGLILFLRANKAEAEAIAALSKEAQKPFIGETTYGLRRAAKKYEEILAIDDGHEVAIARLAWIHQILGLERGDRDYLEPAEKLLLRAEKKAADHPLTVAAAITRKVNLGQAADALKLAKDYEAKHDGNLPLSMKVAMGKALVANGQMQGLEPLLNEMKKADRPGPLYWAGSTWRRLGDELEAAIAFDNAIKFEPDHDPSRAERALLLLEIRDLGRVDVVLADLQHLSDLGKAQLGPIQDGYASLARAEINRLLEKEDDAKTNMESAQGKLTRNAELLTIEARWAFAKDAHDQGMEKVEKSLEIDPNRVRPWKMLIEEAAAKKETRDKADKAFDDARKIFGDHGLLIEARVELLGRERKLGEAAKYLDELTSKPDVAPEVYRELGRIQLAKRDYKAAIATLEDAVKKVSKRPKLTKASTLTLLGRAHAANEDHGKAIDAYKEAIQAAGSYAPAYYYLARSFQANEQNGAAKEAYLRASKLDPTSSMGRAAEKAAEKL